MTLTGETSAGFNIQRTFQEVLWTQNPLHLKYKLLKNLRAPPPPPQVLKARYGPARQ